MTLEELEKRIQTIEDIEAIKMMHREYIFLLINREFEKMADYFAEDATMDMVTYGKRLGEPTRMTEKGRDKIEKLLMEVIARADALPVGEAPKGGHFLVQPVVTVDGNKAEGHWILHRLVEEPVEPSGSALKLRQARYDCKYIKIDGKWKFSAVKLTHPWPEKPKT